MSEKFQYSTTFSDNILVVGQTGCGKTILYKVWVVTNSLEMI